MPKPPADQNERWARPLRTYTAVLPPYNGLDFATVRRDKSRFVENIWAAQAKLRTSSARVMISSELPLGPSDTFGRAKLYSTVIDSETASAAPKVICYIDEREDMSTPALGHSLLAFRLQVMPGGMIRFYHVDDAGVDDREVLDASEVLEHMMSTSESVIIRVSAHISPPKRYIQIPFLNLFSSNYPCILISPLAAIVIESGYDIAKPLWSGTNGQRPIWYIQFQTNEILG